MTKETVITIIDVAKKNPNHLSDDWDFLFFVLPTVRRKTRHTV